VWPVCAITTSNQLKLLLYQLYMKKETLARKNNSRMGNLCQLRFHKDIEKGFFGKEVCFFFFIYRLEISCWKFYEWWSLFKRNVKWIKFQHRRVFQLPFLLLNPLVGFCKTSYTMHLPPLKFSSIFHHISSLCFYSPLTTRIYSLLTSDK